MCIVPEGKIGAKAAAAAMAFENHNTNGSNGANGSNGSSGHAATNGKNGSRTAAAAKGGKRVKFEVVDAPERYPGRREEPSITWFATMTTYFTFIVVIVIGHLRDFCGRVFRRSRYLDDVRAKEGYAPLFKSFENFYTRRLYHRIQHCWNRPVCSSPGAHIEVMERESTDGMKTLKLTNRTKSMLNLGSYNYLGFADDWSATCRSGVMPVLDKLPVGCSINRKDYGTTTTHRELEEMVARFLGKEECIVFNMGYGTNATTIPALCSAGTLVVSDCLNHMSIVSGCRAAGAHIRVFKHNDAEDLEAVLREAVVMGMPRTRRPWKKVLVVVEGIYSMEGEVADLGPIVRVAKKHKAYVYLDEAHSIGALGKTGRGACEYCGVDSKDVDVMMGLVRYSSKLVVLRAGKDRSRPATLHPAQQ